MIKFLKFIWMLLSLVIELIFRASGNVQDDQLGPRLIGCPILLIFV